MTLVYVAGPFRAKPDAANQWVQWQNVLRAAALALEVWKVPGAVAICPHLNTAFYEGSAPAETWLNGDLEILRRCDAVLMTRDWELSEGARAEKAFAEQHGIPVLHSVAAVASLVRKETFGIA